MPRLPDANPAGNVLMTVIALLLQLAERVDVLTRASVNAVKELFVMSSHIKLFVSSFFYFKLCVIYGF